MTQKGLAPILIVLILAALVGGYFIFTNYKLPVFDGTNNQTKTTPSQTTQPSPSPSDETANWQIYVHPTLNYTVKYPTNWRLVEDKRDKWYPNQHADFIIQSPDYKEAAGLAFITIVSGTEITITTGKPSKPFKNIEDDFNEDPLLHQIAENKTNLSVDDIPAIQYDWLYESSNTTSTIFLYKDLIYNVSIDYPNNAEWRTTNWDIYQQVLSSFELNN